MVLDFMTVAAFVLLCAYKLGLTLLSMSASVVASQKYSKFLQEAVNKCRLGDVYYIAVSPPFRSRVCWPALMSVMGQFQSTPKTLKTASTGSA